MKKVSIKYNPYLLTTEITVDGKQPKKNSSLNVGNKRLQEWVEQLPSILLKEYGDQSVKVEFTGTQADFEDVEMSFDAVKNKMKAECHLNKKADNADVEVEITKIFNDIQAGPVKELKDKKIVSALRKLAKSYENGEIVEVRDELLEIVNSIDEFVQDFCGL